jgi:hypothetical protein
VEWALVVLYISPRTLVYTHGGCIAQLFTTRRDRPRNLPLLCLSSTHAMQLSASREKSHSDPPGDTASLGCISFVDGPSRKRSPDQQRCSCTLARSGGRADWQGAHACFYNLGPRLGIFPSLAVIHILGIHVILTHLVTQAQAQVQVQVQAQAPAPAAHIRLSNC